MKLENFLEKWTLDNIKNMTLEQYTGIGENRDDFTYWIESKMSDILSIWGGSSYKFGIYKRHPNSEDNFINETKRRTDGYYAWLVKYGNSKEKAFQKVKELIVSIVENAMNKEFKKIDDIDIGNAYKWAIAYYFAPKKSLLKVASGDAYKYFSKKYFDGKEQKISSIQEQLISKKPNNISLDSYSEKLWDEFATKKKNTNQPNNEDNLNEDNMSIPLNQILYGPPGTGKTYSTVEYALKILEATDKQKENVKSIGQLKKEFGSQVEFVTFHQSFSYEDFVEGLKANTDDGSINYSIENGVFKEICENAKENLENSQNTVKNKIDVKLLLNDFANYIEGGNVKNEKLLLAKKIDGFWGDTYFGEILRKSDETFKSFKTTGSVASQNLTEKIIVRDYQSFYDGNIKGYKDIKPTQKSKASYHGNALYYYQLFKRIKEFQNGDFEQVGSYHITNSDSIKKPYVLIIDEINRGNISRIFGELITLIESSKRAGNLEEISVQLPYSKEDFSVPNNLYIIGTMNTADRSLTLMDTALRRRFDFVEMLPNADLVNGNFDNINLREILKVINQRIEVLYDREHTIGHSFLMNIHNLAELKNAFKNKILPLLEEYFYDNFIKIKAVLNDKNNQFYQEIKQDENLFSDMLIKYDQERKIYNRQNCDELTAKNFINIYKSQ